MLLNKASLTIFEPFLLDYSLLATGSSIAKEKKLNQKTVSNYLTSLEKQGILKSKIQGNNKLYHLNFDNKEIIFRYICSQEHLRTIFFLEKNLIIKELCKSNLFSKDSITGIFGSYAKNENKKTSDIDVFTNENSKNFEEFSEIYKTTINISRLTHFKKEDFLANEIMKNHILLYGVEKFVLKVMEDRKDSLVFSS